MSKNTLWVTLASCRWRGLVQQSGKNRVGGKAVSRDTAGCAEMQSGGGEHATHIHAHTQTRTLSAWAPTKKTATRAKRAKSLEYIMLSGETWWGGVGGAERAKGEQLFLFCVRASAQWNATQKGPIESLLAPQPPASSCTVRCTHARAATHDHYSSVFGDRFARKTTTWPCRSTTRLGT